MKDFEFIYDKNKGNEWQYNSFVRMIDRPINEQKEEIEELLRYDFDKILLKAVKNCIEDVEENIVSICFSLRENINAKTKINMSKIYNLKIGKYI